MKHDNKKESLWGPAKWGPAKWGPAMPAQKANLRYLLTLLLPIALVWTACNQNPNNQGNLNSGNTSGGYNPSQITGGSSAGEWGGVTCINNSTHDFLQFMSNGTDIRNSVGQIPCQPSDTGGILFKMQVVLNAPFNAQGGNNNLSMQPASSSLEIVILDNKAGQDSIGAKFRGEQGQINGNQATLRWIYNGQSGWKKLTLEGTFDANFFSGKMYFENEKRLVPPTTENGAESYTTPGAKGTLGDFRIPTQRVFTSG